MRYLSAAVYAYAYLFPPEGIAPPEPTDPRYRLACDLYNRGLTEGIDWEKLAAEGWAPADVEAVAYCIEVHPFSRGITPTTLEAKVLQDADRLDSSSAGISNGGSRPRG